MRFPIEFVRATVLGEFSRLDLPADDRDKICELIASSMHTVLTSREFILYLKEALDKTHPPIHGSSH